MIEAFEQDPSYNGAPSIITAKGMSDLPLLIRTGLTRADLKSYGGTWAHPDIAIQFAQWCNPGFALWVSRQIRHLLTFGEVNLHHREWTREQHSLGFLYNREDINDLYGR